MRDLFNNCKVTQLFPPKAATTDNTAYTSVIIDTQGLDSLLLAWTMGTLTDADFTSTVAVNHGNDPALADGAAVAAADLLGTLAGCAPDHTSSGKTFKIGYAGNKRYVQVVITPASNTGNIFLAGVAIQGMPRSLPQSAQAA